MTTALHRLERALPGSVTWTTHGPRRYLHSARLFAAGARRCRQRLGDRRQAATRGLRAPGSVPTRARRSSLSSTRTCRLSCPTSCGSWTPMQAAGSRVVILTLPGLYQTDRDPSPRALEIGHLPTFTDNPFVLARMAELYSELSGRLPATVGWRSSTSPAGHARRSSLRRRTSSTPSIWTSSRKSRRGSSLPGRSSHSCRRRRVARRLALAPRLRTERR